MFPYCLFYPVESLGIETTSCLWRDCHDVESTKMCVPRWKQFQSLLCKMLSTRKLIGGPFWEKDHLVSEVNKPLSELLNSSFLFFLFFEVKMTEIESAFWSFLLLLLLKNVYFERRKRNFFWCSVTRFGLISPLGLNFKCIWQSFECLFSNYQWFEPIWEIFLQLYKFPVLQMAKCGTNNIAI